MYRPKQAYEIRVIPKNDNGKCAVEFLDNPDLLTVNIFKAMGFFKPKNSKVFTAVKEDRQKSLAFANLMKASLKVGQYPETIPYQAPYYPDKANIKKGNFSIATIEYGDESKHQEEKRLLFERYQTRRDGYGYIVGLHLKGSSFKSCEVSDATNRIKEGLELKAKKRYNIRFPEPFGEYRSETTNANVVVEQISELPKDDEQENTLELTTEKKERNKNETEINELFLNETNKSETFFPKIAAKEKEMEEGNETVLNESLLNETDKNEVILKESGFKPITTEVDRNVNQGTEVSHFDAEQAKTNYQFLTKLLPNLIAEIDRGVAYSESLSENSDFTKVIFKVEDQIENDLLDITLELIPSKEKDFHYHQLTIRIQIESNECLLTNWITVKGEARKERNIPLFGLTSLLNKLLNQGHLFALSEEELVSENSQENNDGKQTTTGLSPIKHIKLSIHQNKEQNQIEFGNWNEANASLKAQSSTAENSINVHFTIVWQNGMLLDGQFDLFSDQFHPSYEQGLLQKVAIHSFLKSEYKTQQRFGDGSLRSTPHNKKKKELDLSYLDDLDLGAMKDYYIQEYQPKIPAVSLEVTTKMIRAQNRYESSRKFQLANEFLAVLKANGSSEDKVALKVTWRDGARLSTKVKIKSIPKSPNSLFWQTLLKSKTKIADVNSYQLSDDSPLLFDHEIDFTLPNFYYTALESAYWHKADKDSKNKMFFSGYLYHKKHLAKAIQKYLNALSEEDENELIASANQSMRQKSVLDFILSYKKLEADNHNLQYAQITQLIEEASNKDIENAEKTLEGLLLQFQGGGTMVALPESRSQNNLVKAKAPKESKRINRNREIEKLLKEKGSDYLQYSEEELQLLNTYSGYGGSKLSEVNKGLLYEYYTPDEIVRYMWGFAFKHGYQSGAVLEPSCGIGKFLKYAPKNSRIEGYETNPFSAQIAQILYPHASIYQKSFEQLFFNGNIYLKGSFRADPFDLIIGNPPYGSFSGKYAGMGEKRRTKAFTYDQYFLTRGLDLLVSGGLLIFIIPQSFLDNNARYNPLKERIAGKADFLEARRLPHGIFEYTEVGTDIVVFRKK